MEATIYYVLACQWGFILPLKGLRFTISGIRVLGLGFRVYNFRDQGLGIRV